MHLNSIREKGDKIILVVRDVKDIKLTYETVRGRLHDMRDTRTTICSEYDQIAPLFNNFLSGDKHKTIENIFVMAKTHHDAQKQGDGHHENPFHSISEKKRFYR